MNPSKRACRACAVAALLVAAHAAAAPDPPREAEIQVFIENDLLERTDRYYTNGIKIGFGERQEALAQFLRAPALGVLNLMSRAQNEATCEAGKPCPGGTRDKAGVFVGQNMYTPRSITQAAPQPNDRPWAAFLYAGVVAQRVRDETLDTAEFDLGVVGPLALGQQVQTWWHEHISHSPEPLGWGNQLPNEPAFLLSYVHKRRHALGPQSPFGIEAIPHAGFSIGTVATLTRAGGMLRIGHNMTGFGPDNIEPGGASLQSTFTRDDDLRRRSREFYAFVGFDARHVIRNIFLDGTAFRDSASVGRRPFVLDVTTGISYRESRWPFRLSIVKIRRSEEFRAPGGGGGKQSYHSVNVGINF